MAKNAAKNWSDTTLIQHHFAYLASNQAFAAELLFSLGNGRLAEQGAIVKRVEALMTTCRAVEAEIEQSRTHAADLLQAVLKEAFAPAS
jgi:hypothetical protein